jgi:serine/threonine protein kinase
MATPQIIVAKTYRLCNKIGEGSFGKLFIAKKKDDSMPEKSYAIKLITNEDIWQNEVMIYEKLKGSKHIPKIYASGTEGKFNYIVMDLLEQNLEQLQSSFGSSLNLKIIIHLGIQMLNIVEEIHNRGIIHRDIKPANFLIRTNEQNISELYLIDFGLSRAYMLEEHSPIKINEKCIGTPRYMSVATQQGLTSSRRDDLESLGYILIFLQKGELPWEKAGDMALPIKHTMGWAYSYSATNAGGIVDEFILFINYCRHLPFKAKPNYDYLRGLLSNLSNII